MTREELEHIIRASGDITDQYEFVIVGSQSILARCPGPRTCSRCPWKRTSIPCRHQSWPTESTAPSAKARSSTKPTATTPKVLGRKRRACQRAGCSACIASRTAIRRIGDWLLSGRSRPLPRQGCGRTREGSGVLHCTAAVRLCEPGSRPGTRGQHAPRCQGAADLAGDDTAVGKECRSFDCLSCWRAG